jgi:preprotein translocase subunit SecG
VLRSPAPRPLEDLPRVNTFLAIGQIIVSIGLIASVLLQARGTGLSGAFGGDSAVYRSRRGVERRLWQFTIILAILFAVFSLASYVFAPTKVV